MVSYETQNYNLLNEINNIDNLALLNKIENIISFKKYELANLKVNANKDYLQELINSAKTDFATLDENKDIDEVIAEMRGNYENITAKIYIKIE